MDAGISPDGGAHKPKTGRPKVSPQNKLLIEKLRLARDGSPGTATILALGDGRPRRCGHGLGGRPSGLRVLPSVDPV
jgi:hypothetical protein